MNMTESCTYFFGTFHFLCMVSVSVTCPDSFFIFPWGRTIPSSVGRFPVTLNKLRRCCPELLGKLTKRRLSEHFFSRLSWTSNSLCGPYLNFGFHYVSLCLLWTELMLTRCNQERNFSNWKMRISLFCYLECINVTLINFRMVAWWYVTRCHPKRWLELSPNVVSVCIIDPQLNKVCMKHGLW